MKTFHAGGRRRVATRLLAAGLTLTAAACHRHQVRVAPRDRVEAYMAKMDAAPTDNRLSALRAYGNGLADLLERDMQGPELEQAATVLQQRGTCLSVTYGHKAHAHILALQESIADTPETHRRLLRLLSETTLVDTGDPSDPEICSH